MKQGSETILLVEDEPDVCMLVRTLFEYQGYRVLEAASGKEALGVWKEHADKVDMMLTDIVMPDGITGIKLAELLRKDRPELKVVFSSGYGPEAVAKECLSSPGNSFLQKPYDLQVLLSTVRNCIDGK